MVRLQRLLTDWSLVVAPLGLPAPAVCLCLHWMELAFGRNRFVSSDWAFFAVSAFFWENWTMDMASDPIDPSNCFPNPSRWHMSIVPSWVAVPAVTSHCWEM